MAPETEYLPPRHFARLIGISESDARKNADARQWPGIYKDRQVGAIFAWQRLGVDGRAPTPQYLRAGAAPSKRAPLRDGRERGIGVASKKAAPPTPQQRWGARAHVSIADRTSPIAKPPSQPPQAAVVRAALIGSDHCSAIGITATGHAPVLELCRTLLAAGHDPDRPLHVYRGEVLALAVRSIGEGARLRVASHGVGFECLSERTGRPPARENGAAGTRLSGSAQKAGACGVRGKAKPGAEEMAGE